MLLTVFYTGQALLIAAGLFFLYQCAVFVWYFGRGLFKGENGITLGLLVVYFSLLLSGLAVAADGLVLGLNTIYGPFGFLALAEAHPTPYVVMSGMIHLVILLIGIIGNHLLYFALRNPSEEAQ